MSASGAASVDPAHWDAARALERERVRRRTVPHEEGGGGDVAMAD